MNYENLNDYEIVSYISENNEIASEIIFEKYKPLIYDRATKLYAHCKNCGAELNDLIQEGMIGLNNAINSFNDSHDACFYTYALKCINSRIISYIVKLRRLKNKALNESVNLEVNDYNSNNDFGKGLVDNSYNPENILIDSESKTEIIKLIDEVLSDVEFSIMNLKINGFSYKEIADITGNSIKFVDNTIQKAKNKIREKLNTRV